MEIQYILDCFAKYGLIFMFVIIFLEHMNCPGVPATIVMPTIGAFVAESNGSLILVVLISILASIIGSMTLYYIGYKIGITILDKINSKVPKTKIYTEKILYYSNEYGNKAIFICRLIPVVRILVSLISGIVRGDFTGFILYSTLGISIWNFTLISFGYFGARAIF